VNKRPSTRDLMIAAIAVAALLDFSANWLAAHVLLQVGPFLIPGGTFVFALGFTTYDYIRRQHGFAPTLYAIGLGFIASVLYSAVFGGGVGRIAVAGLVALACSSTTDLLTQTVTLRWPIWQYVSTSNAVSLLIDTVVFTTIAFAALPVDVRLHIIAGQYLAKIAMTIVSVPLVYSARSWTARVGVTAQLAV
jgi:uncharacterized PurR-regulated membrane protein YhhQ (DUF165 family)